MEFRVLLIAVLLVAACGGDSNSGNDIVVSDTTTTVPATPTTTTTTVQATATTRPSTPPGDGLCEAGTPVSKWANLVGVQLGGFRFPDGKGQDGSVYRLNQFKGDPAGYAELDPAAEAAWTWLRDKPFGYGKKRGVVLLHQDRYYALEATRFEPNATNTGELVTEPPCRIRDSDATLVGWYQLYAYETGYQNVFEPAFIWYWVWQYPPNDVQIEEADIP